METLHMTPHMRNERYEHEKRWEQKVDIKNQVMTEDGCSTVTADGLSITSRDDDDRRTKRIE